MEVHKKQDAALLPVDLVPQEPAQDQTVEVAKVNLRERGRFALRRLERALISPIIYPGSLRSEKSAFAYREWNDLGDERITKVAARICGMTIDGRILDPPASVEHTGKVVILASGNAGLYEDIPPSHYNYFMAEGYSVCVYNPPGYGASTGVRSPESDAAAIDAVIVHLIQERGFVVENIELQGASMGSGPVCSAASRFPVGKVTLHVPIGTMESVVERTLCNVVSPTLGKRLAAWIRPTIQEYFGYDNVAMIAQSQAAELVIYERTEDEMMTLGGTSEATKLTSAWSGCDVTHYQSPGDHCAGLRSVFRKP